MWVKARCHSVCTTISSATPTSDALSPSMRAFVVRPNLGTEVQGYPRGNLCPMIRRRPVSHRFTAWRVFEVRLAKDGAVCGDTKFVVDACSHYFFEAAI